MVVLPFDIFTHFEDLKRVFRLRELDDNELMSLPDIGYIAFSGEMVAAAFLRKVEGNFAMIDGLITDPLQASAVRHKAIDLIVKRLIAHARELEIKRLMALSIDESTLKRSKAHGFEEVSHKVISLDLRSI